MSEDLKSLRYYKHKFILKRRKYVVRMNLTSGHNEGPVPTPQLWFHHFRLMQMLSNPHSQQHRLHILTITLHPAWHAASRPLQAKRFTIQRDNTDDGDNNNAWHNERHALPGARRRQQDSWHCDKYRFKELPLLPCLAPCEVKLPHCATINTILIGISDSDTECSTRKSIRRFTVAQPEIRGFRVRGSYVTSCTWLDCV